MPTEHSASDILARVVETYASCRSYREDGDVQTVFITGKMPWHRRTTRKRFRTAFVRPAWFFFEYRDVGLGPESEWPRGVIWTDETGLHSWNTTGALSQKAVSISDAVGGMAGISNMGSTFASKLLIAEVKGHSPLPDPTTAHMVGEEVVEDVDCYRIEGIRFGEENVTIWVERTSFLVRRLDRGKVFAEKTLRRQQQQVRDAVAKMPVGDPNRAMIEKGLAMRAERPAQRFQTEQTTIRRAVVNVEIDESAFAFTQPV